MPTVSVNTNKTAMTALQNLNATTRKLEHTQTKISTGLDVSSAKDNASLYSIAQGQRADLSSLNAVKTSLNRATSVADVTLAAGESVSDLLVQMRDKVVSAMDPSISTASRNALNGDFKELLKQVKHAVDNATFDGTNLLNNSITNGIAFIDNADGSSVITLSSRNFSLGGSIISLASTANVLSLTLATSALAKLDSSIELVNANLAALGSQAKQIEGHLGFVSKLSDVIEVGIGNLVDADLAKESARLQALQVQQQLGTQALSIANQAPQAILSLFQG
ncbi:flagellin [Asticcacaulis sp. BYS171W]|uniref:Flagellin n=1 Tax=Asticcacaulis aquaticus TaxID=2984212 RepID=A0ABT5HW87_9CAUL|nr:flagellin [Asticcacaulis aquaticus]MDC7684341.1 flagellin [Asticcacaulis aquaticus]